MSVQSRKLGNLEKNAMVFYDYAVGSCSVGEMIKIESFIEFDLFKKAWGILFDAQPLLRATCRRENGEYFFDLNADFQNIPMKHLQTDHFADVDQEYSRDIIQQFDLDRFLWRATLVTMPQQGCSYLIIGISHAISDARSISWLFGDLLRIISNLKRGKLPNQTIIKDLVPSIDDLLDYSQFEPPSEPHNNPMEPLHFEQEVDCSKAVSKNIFRTIEPKQFAQFHDVCRHHDVTINSALTAVFVKTIAEWKYDSHSSIDVSVAFSLRSYARQSIPNQVCAFYANMIPEHFESTNISFWELATIAQEKCRDGIKHYQLPDSNCDALIQAMNDSYEKNQFLASYPLTNVGVVDEAFYGCEEFGVDEFYFTALNPALMGICLTIGTINNKLCLDFVYSEPALSERSMQRFVDIFMQYFSDEELF